MKLRFKFQVGPEQWPALPRVFKVGEQVTRFRGHTFGLDRDDMTYMGVETIPIENGEGFFTCPVAFLETEDGIQPSGDYVRLPSKKKAK